MRGKRWRRWTVRCCRCPFWGWSHPRADRSGSAVRSCTPRCRTESCRSGTWTAGKSRSRKTTHTCILPGLRWSMHESVWSKVLLLALCKPVKVKDTLSNMERWIIKYVPCFCTISTIFSIILSFFGHCPLYHPVTNYACSHPLSSSIYPGPQSWTWNRAHLLRPLPRSSSLVILSCYPQTTGPIWVHKSDKVETWQEVLKLFSPACQILSF